MDELRIPCSACGKSLKVRDRALLGKKVKCPKCGHRFVLEEPVEDEELVEFEMASAVPAQGTSARWVPDDEPVESAPASPAVGVLDHPAPSPSTPAARDEGGVARLRELRRKNAKRRNVTIIVGVLTAVAIGGTWGAIASFRAARERDRIAAEQREREKLAPTEDRLHATGKKELEHNLQLAGAHDPTRGEPIDMRFVPAGASMVFHMRPAELLELDAGQQVLAALNSPVRTWFEEKLALNVGNFPLDKIEELTLCLYVFLQDEPPDVAAVVRFTGPVQRSDLFGTIFKDQISEVPEIWTDGERAYMLQEEGRALAVCPNNPDYVKDMAEATGVVALDAGASIKDLLRHTDRKRHFTAVLSPVDLVRFQEVLLHERVRPLANEVVATLEGDFVESVAWSVHLDRRFYSDLKIDPHATRGIESVTPWKLHEDVRENLDEVPHRLLVMARDYMTPATVGRRKLIGRFPAMMKAYAVGTLGGTAEDYLQMTTVIDNQYAGPNLAAAAMLAWHESTITDFTKTVDPRPTSQLATTVAGRLKAAKMPGDFPNTPLQEVLDFVASEAKIAFDIDGDALKDAGFTKNMRQKLDLGDEASGYAIVKAIVDAYQEKNGAMCLVVDDAAMKATLTTKKFADMKGQTQFPL